MTILDEIIEKAVLEENRRREKYTRRRRIGTAITTTFVWLVYLLIATWITFAAIAGFKKMQTAQLEQIHKRAEIPVSRKRATAYELPPATFEWFYDTHRSWRYTAGHIYQFVRFYREEAKRGNINTGVVRVDLHMLRSQCVTLAGDYNAQSRKYTRSIFKKWGLPHTLDERRCLWGAST